jgi:hypothetical protein
MMLLMLVLFFKLRLLLPAEGGFPDYKHISNNNNNIYRPDGHFVA